MKRVNILYMYFQGAGALQQISTLWFFHVKLTFSNTISLISLFLVATASANLIIDSFGILPLCYIDRKVTFSYQLSLIFLFSVATACASKASFYTVVLLPHLLSCFL